MKLVLVGPAYPLRGGIAQYNSSLYEALSRHHEVLLISFRRQYPRLFFPGTSQEDQSLVAYAVQGERLFDSISLRSWQRAVRRIRAFQADGVVFQWWQPFFGLGYSQILRGLKKGPGVPGFFLCHNIYSHEDFRFSGRSLGERWLIRQAFSRADGFLIHAASLETEIREFNDQAPVRHIYHPLYDFYLRWDSEPAVQPPAGPPTLLFFGKIRKYKGLDTFLKALHLLKNWMDFRAVVAGEFYVEESPYRRLAERLGLQAQLRWENRYIPNEEVAGLFRQSHLVVLPYRHATQSGVVPVAYQFDVPVIATDVGGLSEVVLDGKTGFLVPPDQPEILARRILQYFQQGCREKFQAEIRSFKGRLSWQQVTDTIVDLLQQVRGT